MSEITLHSKRLEDHPTVKKPIQVWDIEADEWREATQEDFDLLAERCVAFAKHRDNVVAETARFEADRLYITQKYAALKDLRP